MSGGPGNAANFHKINKERREATHCKRGHSNWGWKNVGDGKKRRYCITCKVLRSPLPKPIGPFNLRQEEIDVLQAAANGLSVEEAAKILHYGHSSISDQRMRAFKKLGVHTIAHAVAKAMRYGIIT